MFWKNIWDQQDFNGRLVKRGDYINSGIKSNFIHNGSYRYDMRYNGPLLSYGGYAYLPYKFLIRRFKLSGHWVDLAPTKFYKLMVRCWRDIKFEFKYDFVDTLDTVDVTKVDATFELKPGYIIVPNVNEKPTPSWNKHKTVCRYIFPSIQVRVVGFHNNCPIVELPNKEHALYAVDSGHFLWRSFNN